MFQIKQFLKHYHIPSYTEGYKQCGWGWINIECPFCGGNPHLGISLETGAINCYQCEKHSQTAMISKLLSCSWNQANDIRKEYTTKNKTYHKTEINNKTELKTKLKLPYKAGKLTEKHIKYLESRGLNAKETENKWDLKGTNHLGDYRGRIVAPIYHQNKLVSYQCRDITNRQSPKYKACKIEDEIIPHKHLLYGLWNVKGSNIVVVEGIGDVWKLGSGSVATFGIEWKREQAMLLLPFENIFIWFDPEKQAQKQASKLANFLCVMGKSVDLIDYKKSDPGDITHKIAKRIMKGLI